MTAPSYTEDLTDIATGDESTGWDEFTGNSYDGQGTEAYQDPDYPFIQGQYSVTQDCTKDATVGSLGYTPGTFTIPTDGAVFVWQNYMVASNIGTYAQGGFRVVIGSAYTTFYAFYTGGVDRSPYPYGGWDCQVANPTVTPDDTAGGYTGTPTSHVGGAVYVITGSSKGEVHNVDVMRYGRGSSIFEFGDSGNGYCTFAGFAAVNDNNANRWGLIQETAGGYLWQGRMQLGSSTNLVDFRDSNKTIFIKWTPKVTKRFNMIEILNSSSYIDWSGITFQVLDTTTASRGWFKMTDPATLYWDGCTFIDMDKFYFYHNTNPTQVDGTTWRRCATITQLGTTFDGCTFSNCTSAICLSADNLETITNCDFISNGIGHAIELTASGDGDLILDGNTFTNYASANGSTGNEAIYNNTGNAITINVTNSTSIPSYRNGIGASTTITLSVSLTLSGIVSGSEVRIQQARGTAPSGAELYHVETTDGTDVVWSYNYSDFGAGYYIDIIVHNIYYTHLRIDDILLPATNSTIPIQQSLDRWYDNP